MQKREEGQEAPGGRTPGPPGREDADGAVSSADYIAAVVDHLHDGLFLIDPADRTILMANRAFCAARGLTREEVVGRRCHQLIHDLPAPCCSPDVRCPLTETLATGKPATVEKVCLDADGARRHVEITTIPIFGRTGAVAQVIHLSRDITDRRRAEESLQKSNLELLAIIDNLPFLAWLKDRDGRFIAVNEPFARACGIASAGDLVGKSDLDVWPEHLARAYQADDREVMRSRRKKAVEERVAERGVERWFETFKAPLVSPDGDVVGTTGISRDVTDRRQAEEVLRVTQFAVDRAAESIAWIGPDGRYLYVNDFYCRLLGYSREEFLAMGVWDLDPALSKEEWPLRWERLRREGSRVFEAERRAKGGALIPFEVHSNFFSHGGREFIVAFLRDIRERKGAEAELLRTLESLRKAFGATVQAMVAAVEARDPYTAGHQLRTADLARAIASEMGLQPRQIDAIRTAGAIHDIGKLSIPAEILAKPTRLTETEFALIREHAKRGCEMLSRVESPWPLAEIVRHHHERLDGSGYPDGLRGEEIPIEARVLAVADVVEAMASHRPYRPGLGIDSALMEIEIHGGLLYDSAASNACLRLFREKRFRLQEV